MKDNSTRNGIGVFALICIGSLLLALGAMASSTPSSGKSGTSGSTSGKPAVGTQACLDAQLAYAHTLPDRKPYDDAETSAMFANMDDLCVQPGRITH